MHPSQQEQLNASLRVLSNQENQQVLVTSHSSTFTSKNIYQISNIIRICKSSGRAKIFQIDVPTLERLIEDNAGLYSHFCDILNNPLELDEIKKKIIRGRYGDEVPDEAAKLIEEELKYFLWLDSERSSMFFAKHIVICEGACEKIFIDFMLNEYWHDLKNRHLYCLDSLGKFNIHRYMNLLGCLGIEHSIIMDRDQDSDIQRRVNEFIDTKRNSFTKEIHLFDLDFENFLGIPKPPNQRNDLKPMNVMKRYHNNEINESRLDELKSIVKNITRE